MHSSFLSRLADPVSGDRLSLTARVLHGDIVVEGELSSARASYPVRAGIPVFAGCQDGRDEEPGLPRNSTASLGRSGPWDRLKALLRQRGCDGGWYTVARIGYE